MIRRFYIVLIDKYTAIKYARQEVQQKFFKRHQAVFYGTSSSPPPFIILEKSFCL